MELLVRGFDFNSTSDFVHAEFICTHGDATYASRAFGVLAFPELLPPEYLFDKIVYHSHDN